MEVGVIQFWEHLQKGIDVIAKASFAFELLGIKDAFKDYFSRIFSSPISLVIVPYDNPEPVGFMKLENEILLEGRRVIDEMLNNLPEYYDFLVWTSASLKKIEIGDEEHLFLVRWAMVHCPVGYAIGSSGAVEVPKEMLRDGKERVYASFATLKKGGMFKSLTGGMSSGRDSVKEAVVNAIASIFVPYVEKG